MYGRLGTLNPKSSTRNSFQIFGDQDPRIMGGDMSGITRGLRGVHVQKLMKSGKIPSCSMFMSTVTLIMIAQDRDEE